ncbi:MAG TPA: STAS domain-containing protein [Polyangium sp.]|nr:STAS domain-containing protein [Polyangium sp.]
MESADLEALAAENEALRRRVETLEAERASGQTREMEQARRIAKLERVLAELPLIVDIFDVTTARSTFKNRALDPLLGYPPGALDAMGPQPMLYKTVHVDDIPLVLEFLTKIRNDVGDMEDAFVEYRVNRGDGAPGWFRAHLRPFERNDDHRLATVLMVTYDVSETKLAENALRALNEELDGLVAERTASLEDTNRKLEDEVELRTQMAIEAERRARLIRELSSPLLRVGEDIIAVPIIGTLDTERAAMIQESVLHAISDTGVSFAILDLTGVGAMDAATAEHIERLVSTVGLLGAEVVICGIGSAVARVMIENGLSLKGVTVKNLREGIRYCLGRKRNRTL